jgi:hypothetical protein
MANFDIAASVLHKEDEDDRLLLGRLQEVSPGWLRNQPAR